MPRDEKGHGGGFVYPNKEMIAALERNKGAVYKTATELGCSYRTILRRAEKVQIVKDAIDKYRFVRTDVAEDKLGAALERGEPWAILFQLRTQGRQRGYYERMSDAPKPESEIDEEGKYVNPLPSLPADVIAPSFLSIYRDVVRGLHMEYVLFGGRGSTKSSFISLILLWLLVNYPDIHILAVRQVATTLRDSVVSQIKWAIDALGLGALFKSTVSPMEIEYLPTGQKIYFRGADDPSKVKSIKPPFGYIGALWFEELDQFRGEEAIRKVEQSAIRGGDTAYIFKSFNPPRSINNWANKYIKIPKESQLQHESVFTDVPKEWLGRAFLDEAEHLAKVNPAAYEHEYLGVPNSAGGMVFENIQVRKITDAEIFGAQNPKTGEIEGGFDRVLHGMDFGYYPDPAHYVRAYYDAARLTLYVFGELRWHKASNKKVYNNMVEYGLMPDHLLICDSAEPKSIADLREYGLSARGAEKGPESVNYSIKWLQSLAAIVCDNERAPYVTDELLSYEYEVTKDGEVINAYPDFNNHGIDALRYATNLIWRRRGQ
jgi:PBSX family phage terminase large subunit